MEASEPKAVSWPGPPSRDQRPIGSLGRRLLVPGAVRAESGRPAIWREAAPGHRGVKPVRFPRGEELELVV